MLSKMLKKVRGTVILYGDNGRTRINAADLLKGVINEPWIEYLPKNKNTHPVTETPRGFPLWYVQYKTAAGILEYSLCKWNKKTKLFDIPKGAEPKFYINMHWFKRINKLTDKELNI